MATEATRVGIIGAGWPGMMHARALREVPGVKLAAVSDLIPARRQATIKQLGVAREYADALDLLADRDVDAVCVCLPNDLHEPVTTAALKAGKHVLCESPPALDARQAGRMATAARRADKVLLYALQRRFGAAEQAARQAVAKGYIGEVFHVRASWTRTRATPVGTGWFADKARSGGGALIDLGIQMLDLAWHLMDHPAPLSVYAVGHRRFAGAAPPGLTHNVEDSGFALLKFAGGKSLELACSWSLNQPPGQNGTVCRLYADQGAAEVYTPHGPVLYRGFGGKTPPKQTALKLPKLAAYPALARHFRDCITGKTSPLIGPDQGVGLMRMIDAIYRSIQTGRSVNIQPSERSAADDVTGTPAS